MKNSFRHFISIPALSALRSKIYNQMLFGAIYFSIIYLKRCPKSSFWGSKYRYLPPWTPSMRGSHFAHAFVPCSRSDITKILQIGSTTKSLEGALYPTPGRVHLLLIHSSWLTDFRLDVRRFYENVGGGLCLIVCGGNKVG